MANIYEKKIFFNPNHKLLIFLNIAKLIWLTELKAIKTFISSKRVQINDIIKNPNLLKKKKKY